MPFIYQKNEAGDFVCPTCGITKKNQNTMHYHMKAHEGNLPFVCTTCKKGFLQSQSLHVHMLTVHSNGQKDLKCPCCPFKTTTKANRVIHYVRKHCQDILEKALTIREGVYCCNHCKKECNSNTAFHYHVATCLKGSTQQMEDLQKVITGA